MPHDDRSDARGDVRAEGQRVPIWSALQRLLHWTLAIGIALAWWSGEGRPSLHNGAGYAALIAVSVRWLLGFFGRGNARFGAFVRGPGTVAAYARAMLQGRERRFLGHNPLGGWMVIALMASALVACVSGVLYTTDAFWGMEWLDRLHRASAWTVLVLACIHVSAVLLMSWRHRENLAGSMVTGRKRRTLPARDESEDADGAGKAEAP